MIGFVLNLSIRARLSLSYLAVLCAVLVLFTTGTTVVMYWQLRSQLFRFAVGDIETVEGLLRMNSNGAIALDESYHNHPESRLVPERLLEVRSPKGAVLYRNEHLGGETLGGLPFPTEGVGGYSQRRIRLKDGRAVLVVSRRHVLPQRTIILRLGYTEDSIFVRIEEFLTAAATALPVLLALAGLAAYQLARRSLLPVEQMAMRAEQITADQLHQRLPIPNPNDELGHLGSVINKVLDRLQQSFDQLRQFTADASHELRTPLAAIRSVGEVGLQKSANAAAYKDVIGSMLEEVNRLTRLVESLLTLSRADAGQAKLSVADFSLLRVVEDVAARLEVLVDEKRIEVTLSGDDAVMVKGDCLLLRQAFTNVLHNAVKYTPAGGTIQVTVSSADGFGVVQVCDSGPGIAPEHRQKVFTRFYRIDAARARETGGAGLGLAIAKWAVQIQGGRIGVEDAKAGAILRIQIPLAVGPSHSI